jgi:hypothetical protein
MTETPHTQGFLEMELAGLEPATSWVRCGSSDLADVASLQVFYGGTGTALMAGIAADIGRFSSFQALLAMSA